MKSKDERKVLLAHLEKLNLAVEESINERTKWMDEHMPDFAAVQVGEDLYDGTRKVGVVVKHYRYHAGDAQYDTSMSISYQYKFNEDGWIDNTSRQIAFMPHSKEEAIRLHDALRPA